MAYKQVRVLGSTLVLQACFGSGLASPEHFRLTTRTLQLHRCTLSLPLQALGRLYLRAALADHGPRRAQALPSLYHRHHPRHLSHRRCHRPCHHHPRRLSHRLCHRPCHHCRRHRLHLPHRRRLRLCPRRRRLHLRRPRRLWLRHGHQFLLAWRLWSLPRRL